MRSFVFVFFLALGACVPEQENTSDQNQRSPIEGTWQLIAAVKIVGEDTTYTDYTVGMKGIKMLNQNYFAFFQHDLNKGEDSLARYASGSGSYSFVDGHYIENLEYCTARKWEGYTFEFELTISGDSLIQEGREKLEELGVDRIIRETYIKIED